MKNIIRIFLIIGLVCFSFYYTDKVMNILNNRDPLMIKLNDIKDSYEVLPVNAIINNDTIIPGIKGIEVDVDKSYEEMKLGGIFREEALVYRDIIPSNSLVNNMDKYIIRGSNKNEVALVIIYNDRDYDKIKGINNLSLYLNHNDININNIKKLKNNELYTYGNNGIYSDSILENDNALINRISNNSSKYCLFKEKNSVYLNICNSNNMMAVIPTIIGNYSDIKNKLSNGSIILLNDIDNIDIIIKYITSRGYNIVSLSKLLTE